jgi:hypothetical protein
LSDSLSNEKFKSSTRHQWPIRKFWSSKGIDVIEEATM